MVTRAFVARSARNRRLPKARPASAAADRLSYNARTRKSVQGAGELLDALANNELKLESIDQEKLPAEFQKLSRKEMEARIAKTREERAGRAKGNR